MIKLNPEIYSKAERDFIVQSNIDPVTMNVIRFTKMLFEGELITDDSEPCDDDWPDDWGAESVAELPPVDPEDWLTAMSCFFPPIERAVVNGPLEPLQTAMDI